MLNYIISLTILALAVILLRGLFKRKVSARLTYAIWLAVVLRLCLPFDLVLVDMPALGFNKLETYVSEELSVEVGDVLERFEKPVESGEIGASHDNVTEQDYVPQTGAKPQGGTVKDESPVVNGSAEDNPATQMGQSTVVGGNVENNTPNEGVNFDNSANVEVENATQTATDSPKEGLTVAQVLGVLWASGSAVTMLVFGTSYALYYVRIRRGRRLHGLCRGVKVYVSPTAKTSCVVGVVPSIYITETASESESIDVILAHERTHISHGDHLWNLFRVVAVSLFWWNPVIWVSAVLSMRDAELACDETVAARLDAKDRLEYARLIVDAVPVKNFALGFSGGPIKERVLKLTHDRKTGIIAAIIAVILIGGCVAVAFIGQRSETPAEGETTQTEATPTDPEEGSELEAYKDKFYIQDELTELLEMKPAEIKNKYSKLSINRRESQRDVSIYDVIGLKGVRLAYDENSFNTLQAYALPTDVILTENHEGVLGLSVGKNIEKCKTPVNWRTAGPDEQDYCYTITGFAGRYNVTVLLEYSENVSASDYEFWQAFADDPYGEILEIRLTKRDMPRGTQFCGLTVFNGTYNYYIMYDNVIRYDASTGEDTFDILIAPGSTQVENLKVTSLTWDENMNLAGEEVIFETGQMWLERDALLLTVDEVETLGYVGIYVDGVRAYPARNGMNGDVELVSINDFMLSAEINYAGLPKYEIDLDEDGSLWDALGKLNEDEEFVNLESKVVLVKGLSKDVYIELGEGTDMISAQVYGESLGRPMLDSSTNLYGNINTDLYEYNGAIILNRYYYEAGDTWIFTSAGSRCYSLGGTTSVTISPDEDGGLTYTRFTVKFNAAVHQQPWAPLTLARGRDELLRETGTATIDEYANLILTAEKTETVGEAYDLDAIYEEYKNEDWFKEQYPNCSSADDVMLANRGLITDIETVKAKADEGDERFEWIESFLQYNVDESARKLFQGTNELKNAAYDAAFKDVVFGEFYVEDMTDISGNRYLDLGFEITSSGSADFPVGDYLIKIHYYAGENSISNISFVKRAGIVSLDYEGYEDYFTRRVFNYFYNDYTDVTSPIATLIAYSLYTKVNNVSNTQVELTQEQIEEVGKIVFGEGYEFEDYRLVCAMEKDGVKYYHPVGMGGTSAYHSIISRIETDETITYDIRYHADRYCLTTAFVMRYTFEKTDSEYKYRFVSVEMLESTGLDNYTFST